MKRILCIISSLNAGGAETFLMKVSRALNPDLVQLDFIVSADNGCYTDEVISRGGQIYCIPLRTKDFLGAMAQIYGVVKKHRYTAVLKLGDTPIGALDLIMAKLGGAKRTAFRSCNALTGLSWKQKQVNMLLRPVLNAVADIKFAPSMLAAEFTFGKKQAHKNVHVIHNAVDLSVYRFDPVGREEIRKEFSLEHKFVVGHIGRFNKQKNHRFLLEIFRKIKEQREDAVLMLTGAGELEQEIWAEADRLGILSSVIFTGVRFDIPQVLSAADVFVFPSFHEGMPNTVIEAQATGLPCVISDTITREADITGLVHYLSLEDTPEIWAEQALLVAVQPRKNTKQDFWDHGYDMAVVAREFVSLIFSE